MTTKDKLEELFEQNRMDMEDIQMPEGHRERFMQKLQARPSFIQKVRMILSDMSFGKKAAWVLSPAICVLSVASRPLVTNYLKKERISQSRTLRI